MNSHLQKLAEQIKRDWEAWWESGEGEAIVEPDPNNPNRVEIQLLDDEGEDFYVGNNAEPGLSVEWIGECVISASKSDDPIYTKPLVKVNGIFIQASAGDIVGWALGYDG